MKKVIIATDILKPALKKLSQAINKSSLLPILTNLYIKVYQTEAQLIASDQELTIVYTVPCESKDTFEVLIPFDFIHDVVDLAGPQPMIIEVLGRKATLKLETDSFDLNTLDKVKDYVNLPDVPKDHFIMMDSIFISWLSQAQKTCSRDENRAAMQKICLDVKKNCVAMVSTDANVIFTRVFRADVDVKDRLLISPKIAKALHGFSSTEIFWNKTHLAFKSGAIEIIATRFQDKYPDYRVAFPESVKNLVLDRQHLISALNRACLNTAHIKDTVLYLKKQEGKVHLETDDLQKSRKIQTDIPGKYEGELEKVAVNAEKLLTLMHQIDCEVVDLHIQDTKKPIVITTGADADYKSLIMPLAINE